MAVIEIAKIKVRRGRELQTGVPQLDSGEFGWAEDTEHLYIGKRIVDGAADDENTRILTENDLNYFKLLTLNTGTVTSSYKYRADKAYISSTVTTVQLKLDTLDPSLAEYGVTFGVDNEDITLNLREAVNNLFANTTDVNDARRKLIIPPGKYIVSDVIKLPPYTSISGSGPGITVITFTSTSTNLFKTIDSTPDIYGGPFEFESQQMASGVNASRNINIENMTLQYYTTSSIIWSELKPLISLDNVNVANVRNVTFRATPLSESTATYGFLDAGAGIEIRGSGGSIGSGDTELCQKISIENCVFDSMGIGVLTTGSVINPIIQSNLFTNLYQGVVMRVGAGSIGSSNGVIQRNRFENIVEQGIYVEPNLQGNLIPTNHVSAENLFVQVGNGVGLDDLVTTSTDVVPVIEFNGSGNKSVNDIFRRRTFANTILYGINAPSISGSNGPYTTSSNIPLTFSKPSIFGGIQAQGYGVTSSSGVMTNVVLTNVGRGYTTYPDVRVNIVAAATTVTSIGSSLISISTTASIKVGNIITGPTGIPGGTSVVSIGSNNITISAPTTAIVNIGELLSFDAVTPATFVNSSLVRVDNDFYYTPVVKGRLSLEDSAGFTATIMAGVIDEPILKLYVSDYPQNVNLRYQVVKPGSSRSGVMLISVTPEGNAVLTDNYNYSDSLTIISSNIVPEVSESGVDLLAVDVSVYPEFASVSGGANWYITGTGAYSGKSAYVTSVGAGVGPDIVLIGTSSASPTFDFTDAETFSLLADDTGAPVEFIMDTSLASTKNYVTLNYTNSATLSSQFEYQLNILG
jgi:hypothetical protein